MKAIEILKLERETLKTLQESCVRMADYKYIPLYDEYAEIVNGGGKKNYAVAMLAEKYLISERQVWYLLKRLSRECKIDAV